MKEKQFQKLNKKARGCMLVCEIILALICTAVFGVVWYFVKGLEWPINPDWIWVLVAVIWVCSLVSPFVRYERYRYCFSDEDIDVREGFLFIERNIVPIERLHKVAIESGPIDRMFGLAKVIVTTAGGDVTIRFLEAEMAEQIVDKLKTRINQYAVSKREG